MQIILFQFGVCQGFTKKTENLKEVNNNMRIFVIKKKKTRPQALGAA